MALEVGDLGRKRKILVRVDRATHLDRVQPSLRVLALLVELDSKIAVFILRVLWFLF